MNRPSLAELASPRVARSKVITAPVPPERSRCMVRLIPSFTPLVPSSSAWKLPSGTGPKPEVTTAWAPPARLTWSQAASKLPDSNEVA